MSVDFSIAILRYGNIKDNARLKLLMIAIRIRKKNQNHSIRNILSLTMLRLRTQSAWSMLTVPVREPEGN